MGKVDREEIAQWVKGMWSLISEYAQIKGKIEDACLEDFSSYQQVMAQGELPALLEKIKKMPVPKESKCKSAKKAFELAIGAEIRGRKIPDSYKGTVVGKGDKPIADWEYKFLAGRETSFLGQADGLRIEAISHLASVCEKYQVSIPE